MNKTYNQIIKENDERINISKKLQNYLISFVFTKTIKDIIVYFKTDKLWIALTINLITILIGMLLCWIYIYHRKRKLKKYNDYESNVKLNDALQRLAKGNERFFNLSLDDVYALYQHPYIANKKQDNNFYGWLKDNQLILECENESTGKYLRLDKEKNEDTYVSSDSLNLKLYLKRNKIKSLCLRVIIFDDEKLLGEQLEIPFTDDYLDNTKEKIKNEIEIKTGFNIVNIGIPAITNGELIVFAKARSITNENQISYIENSGIEEISEKITCEDINSKERFAYLIFAFSKCNQYFYTCLYKNTRKITKEDSKNNNHLDIKELGLGKQRTSIIARFFSKIIDALYSLFSDDKETLIYVVITFIFSEVVFPLLNNMNRFIDNKEYLGIEFNADLIYAVISFVVTIIIYLYSKYVCSWINKRINEKVGGKSYFKGVKVCKNTISYFIGYDSKEISINHIYDDKNKINENIYDKNYTNNDINNEINDGEKFRLVKYDIDDIFGGINLTVDSCKYTDIRRFLKLKNQYDRNFKSAKCLYDTLLAESNRVLEGKDYVEEDRENNPPNALCLHMIVLTSDNYLLFTKRIKKVKFENEKYDLSLEEQLSREDLDSDGYKIKQWAKRALREELGLEKKSCGMSDFFDIKVQAIFREDKYINYSISAIVRLRLNKKQIVEIIDGWPREDHEFVYNFITIRKALKFLCKESINSKGEFERNYKQTHPTALFRLYLLLLEQFRFIEAYKLKKIIKEQEKTCSSQRK